jgi:hypothetical protein
VGDFTGKNTTSTTYTLAVCSMTIDEARFLPEWLVYHAAMGVQHFYLYDQGTDRETAEVLAPFQAAGLVTLHRVSGQSREFMFQALLLRQCFDKYGAQAEWISHFDIDEFLNIKPLPYERPQETLAWPRETVMGNILAEEPFRSSAGVMISRQNYVNIGVEHLGDSGGSVVQRHVYRRAVPSLEKGDGAEAVESYKYTKAFAHTRFSSRSVAIMDSHTVRLRLPIAEQALPPPNRLYYNFAGEALVDTLPDGTYKGKMTVNYGRAALNHYMSRDRSECLEKARRRIECCPLSWRAKAGEAWCDSPSFYIVDKSWEAPGQRWILDNLRFDAAAAQSFAGQLTLKTLQAWAATPGSHAWITDLQEWARVQEAASKMTVTIE